MTSPRPLTLWPSFALLAVAGLLVWLPPAREGFVLDLWLVARGSLPGFGAALLFGFAVRALRHRQKTGAWPRPGLRRIAAELPRLAAAFLLLIGVVAVYCWGKLLIPWFRHETLDAPLIAVDRALHLGLDPGLTIQALLEGLPGADRFVDWTYARYPLVLLGAAGWFLSDPDADGRHRWLRGFVLLWLGGLALYWLVPALGPAFVYPELVPVLAERFPIAAAGQRALLENHVSLLALLAGEASLPLRLEYGIAAFPSLHVALPAHAWLVARERGCALRWPFLAITVLFVVGSVATGWHYLIDAWAGLALAFLCWLPLRRPAPERGPGPVPDVG